MSSISSVCVVVGAGVSVLGPLKLVHPGTGEQPFVLMSRASSMYTPAIQNFGVCANTCG